MFRFLALLSVLWAGSTLSAGAVTCFDYQIGDTIRSAVYDHDIARVAQLAETTQRAVERGEISSDEIRCLFEPFSDLHPDVIAFAEDWFEAAPTSPYAQVAAGWSLKAVSWQIRGPNYVRDTYGQALEDFAALQHRAWDHAERAYRAMPELLPASDLLIRLANANGQQKRSAQVVNEVMQNTPNDGTLRRATEENHPGWGGSWAKGKALCETYAPMVPDAPEDAVLRCELPVAARFDESWDWLNTVLASGDYPDFDYLRLSVLTRKQASRDQVQLAYRVMSKPGYSNDTYLYDYDVLALKYGLPLLTETITKRRREQAESEIIRDPMSVRVLSTLGEELRTSGRGANGLLETKVVSRPSPEETLDLARRRVQLTPYDADAWTELLRQLQRSGAITHVGQAEPYRVNSVVYGNHRPARLQSYLIAKIYDYDAFQRVRTGEFPEQARAMFAGLDETVDFLCPILRAQRLFEAVCDGNRSRDCQLHQGFQDAIVTIDSKIEVQDACSFERDSTVAELAFTPMPLP